MMGAETYIGFEPPPPKEDLETLTLSDHHSQIPSIDPPSYSHAVDDPSSSTPKRSQSSDYLKISVTDPRKEHDIAPTSLVPGSATYVTYMISSRTRDLAEFRVRRRFRDFVTLADRLADSHRGLFVPPRPDKNTVESQMMQKHEFVEQRRLQLEKYLWRLAVHPVVGKSEELRPAKGGRDLLRIFKELKQSVTNDWGGARPAVVEEDKEFLERKEKVQELEQQLSTASQQAEALVKAQQDVEETMGQLGLSLIKLVKFENEEAVYNSQRIRAADAKCVATAAVKTSRLYRELNSQAVKHLDILHEYLGVMLAVRGAFSDRSNSLLTVQTLLSDLSSLHAKAEKLEVASSKIFGGDESRIRKLEEIRKTIRATEDAKTCAIREYEKIKENNRCELGRLDIEKHDDFLGMLKGFVTNQVAYSEKIADVWSTVVEETKQYARDTV
ncbi:uncharacterized protein A4U43_C07F6170 [Asparagus officinalis]|uniref:PX domain-containing protein n=1 Tax=Asparagus officinalis TaxID=4686 RepID=A0A5P1EEZ9_ASPOF|nr:uncharacterized protein A4U43_C07F6170 [Asparagus officinalis]